MATKFQIKKIHILKNLLKINDENYRALLSGFGVESSKGLSYEDAAQVVSLLENQAVSLNLWEIRPKKYQGLKRDKAMATEKQLRLMEGVWREIAFKDSDEFAKSSFRAFIHKRFSIDDIMFITKKRANGIITVIKKMKKKHCADAQK